MSDAPTPEEPVTWRVDGFTQANPFTANLVIDTTDSALTLSLDPASLNALHDALSLVRSAQRDAVLGGPAPTDTVTSRPENDTATEVHPENLEPGLGADPDTEVDGDASPETAPTGRKVRLKTIMLGALVVLVLYSLVAGAVLI
jgi:hypothetical protein